MIRTSQSFLAAISAFVLLAGTARAQSVPPVSATAAPSASPGVMPQEPKYQSITVPQIDALEREKLKRRSDPVLRKVSSQLLDAIARGQRTLATPPTLKIQSNVAPSEKRTLVDITADVTQGLLEAISAGHGTVRGSFPDEHSVRALVPLSLIVPLASRNDVRVIEPAAEAVTNSSFLDEADIAHTAIAARQQLGVDGAGVAVGVLSDSASDAALQFAYQNGDLDSTLTSVLPGQAGAGNDEGVAMMELIHALAPKARLIFATAYGGPAQMATNIRALAAAGCHVIVDDVTYFNESPFQDGPISVAVNEASDKGVLYFSSARNSGNALANTSGTWEGWFRDGGEGANGVVGRQHVFSVDASGTNVVYDTIRSVGNGSRVDLFWNDPWEASTNGYNIYIVDPTTRQVIAASTSPGINPYQTCCDVDKNGNLFHPRPGDEIVITRDAGAHNRFIHLDTGRDVILYATGGSVRGHNASAAANAFSIAAESASGRTTPFTGGPEISVESYSSDGPRRMFFKPDGSPISDSPEGILFAKPDLTAADCVATGLATFAPFCGTSAAAPHAAAIAALILAHRRGISPQQVRLALNASALQIGDAHANWSAGRGIIMALAALRAADLVAVSGSSIAASSAMAVIVRSDGTLAVSGAYVSGNQNLAPPSVASVVSAAAGFSQKGGAHAIGLLADGSVVCWGDHVAKPLTMSFKARAIAASDYEDFAVTDDGAVVGWTCASAKNGNEESLDKRIPREFSSNMRSISASGSRLLGLKTDGSVVQWLSPDGGRLGNEIAVPQLAGARVIAAAPHNGFAVASDGTVAEWGSYSEAISAVPPDATNIVSLAAGSAHVMALRTDGTVVAWGSNNYGESTVPAFVPKAVSIGAGGHASFAIGADGKVYSWGDSTSF